MVVVSLAGDVLVWRGCIYFEVLKGLILVIGGKVERERKRERERESV